MDKILRRLSCFFPDEVREIIGRKLQLFRKPPDFGDAGFPRLARVQEFVQQLSELADHPRIPWLPRTELPFIEPQAVIEEQLDVGDEQLPAVPVNRMFLL